MCIITRAHDINIHKQQQLTGRRRIESRGFAYTILLFCFILRLRISEIQLPASSLLFNSVYNETLSARRASLCYKKKKKDNKY